MHHFIILTEAQCAYLASLVTEEIRQSREFYPDEKEERAWMEHIKTVLQKKD